jgi:ubiquinone/menaquinone biosynthesis C-methylase UbiE
MRIDYLGIDVVQSLLDYAASRAPAEYRWVLHRQLSVPAPDASADLAVAFSVFTHLLQAETFLYLEDLRRVLRPGGTLMFSFLEFSEPTHWPVFEATVKAQRKSFVPHLNQFIARDQIAVWARSLGFAAPKFVDSTAAPWGTPGPLGQTIALLTR